jgi:hypothetical protein
LVSNFEQPESKKSKQVPGKGKAEKVFRMARHISFAEE